MWRIRGGGVNPMIDNFNVLYCILLASLNVCDVTAVVVHMVGHDLTTSIRKVHVVRTLKHIVTW